MARTSLALAWQIAKPSVFPHKVQIDQELSDQVQNVPPPAEGARPTVPQLFIVMPAENMTVVFTVSAPLCHLPSRLQTHPVQICAE